MDTYVSIIGLFFGLPPMLYFHHHIKMHHKEGNGPEDLSSTERFRRDSFLGWLNYFLRFVFFGAFEIPYYFLKRKRFDYAAKIILGYIFFYALITASYIHNPMGTITIFIVPTLICWYGLMAGNWTQHAFIDSSDPECPYKNSITVIDSIYNKRCFNDGYHIAHHFFPGMHWSEMPTEFEKHKEEYYQNGAMIFRKLDYQIIWFYLMFKNYKGLAKFYVPPKDSKLNLDQIANIIKNRMAPI